MRVGLGSAWASMGGATMADAPGPLGPTRTRFDIDRRARPWRRSVCRARQSIAADGRRRGCRRRHGSRPPTGRGRYLRDRAEWRGALERHRAQIMATVGPKPWSASATGSPGHGVAVGTLRVGRRGAGRRRRSVFGLIMKCPAGRTVTRVRQLLDATGAERSGGRPSPHDGQR